MNRVTPIPFQCAPTCAIEPKSTFSSIGTIITQKRTATGRLTSATVQRPSSANTAGKRWPRAIPATMQRATHTVR
jgi:hypothetical protein